MLLTREAILAASDLKVEVVEVKEWGGSVRVSTMSGAARDEWEREIVNRANGNKWVGNARALLASYTIVDEQGNRLFSAADIEALGAKNGAALQRVCKVAQKLNRLTGADLEETKGN